MELSVVIPVYGCAGALRELHARLGATLDQLTDEYEIVFVDDRATDGSWELLQELSRADRHVRAFQLSRNFGQHAAITAGLAKCKGRWAVVMDCDLQDPPEEIPRFYAKAAEGYDIVYGRRRVKSMRWHRRLAGKIYFGLMNRFTQTEADHLEGAFSLISRKVIDSFLQLREIDRHYLFILRWLGYSTVSVEYDHAERKTGASSYSFSRLVSHALDGLFFQTTVLLRWIIYVGFVISALGGLSAVYLIYAKVAGAATPGWTSLSVFILTIGGFTIITTGITGLYIGKVFDQVKERPLYVIDRSLANGVETDLAEADPASNVRSLSGPR